MKILFLANAASIHTVRWVNALADRKHEVHLVYNFDDEPRENIISDKVFLHRLKYAGTKGYFFNVLELKKTFRSIKPDVVNVHYASGYGTLARLAKLKPLVLSVWGSDVYDFPYQSRLKRCLIVRNLLYAEQIASTSYSMAEQVKCLIKTDKHKISVTPFGVDINIFSPDNEVKNNKTICIGNIKTLEPKYGIDDLIKSIRILIDNLINKGFKNIAEKIKINIYGDGEQKEELINLINRLGLQNIIYLKGRIPNNEVPKALEEMDIFCVTSVRESFGVAVVEAMSMELPVVATDVSGFREVVEHNVTGIIVKRKNPVAIATALEKLILNEELRIKMGKNGRKRVEELYDWDKNVDSMLEVYEACLNN